jgi:hypothetical protein
MRAFGFLLLAVTITSAAAAYAQVELNKPTAKPRVIAAR